MIKIALALTVIGAFFYAFNAWLNIPYVHKSWTTKECLFVEHADGTKTSCKELPKKYELVWNN